AGRYWPPVQSRIALPLPSRPPASPTSSHLPLLPFEIEERERKIHLVLECPACIRAVPPPDLEHAHVVRRERSPEGQAPEVLGVAEQRREQESRLRLARREAEREIRSAAQPHADREQRRP